MKHLVCIIIPVYLSNPSVVEINSLDNNLSILKKYPVKFVTYANLDVSIYIKYCVKYGVNFSFEYFDDIFFKGTEGYNKLLLSEIFYKRFLDYKFILICQLDAWVFRDELNFWCKKNFTCIGAPLMADNKTPIPQIFNGGFTLRKVKSFLKMSNNQYRFSFDKLFESSKFAIWLAEIYYCLKNLTITDTKVLQNEDVYFCTLFWKYSKASFFLKLFSITLFGRFKIPDIDNAVNFAFERFPSDLYKFNANKLPFGCHAYRKYEYDEFWKQFILK